MVACKVILAVALVSVAFVQINGKPVELKDQLTEWTAPFQDIFKKLNESVTSAVADSKLIDSANGSWNSFADSFKSELSSLSKSLESKSGVSDLVKEATKQWHTAVDTYTKNIPEEFNVKKINEKFEDTLKYITHNATELSKKAQGNIEVDKEIQAFTKKQIDALLEQVRAIQTSTLGEKKA